MISRDATVFVVDSERKTRCDISSLAQQMGLRCHPHAAASDFLTEFDPQSSGCIVLELMLADTSGLHLQQHLAALGEPAMPVIFLTAHGNVRTAVQAMRSGAVHFLEKPLLSDELREAIYEAVSIDHRRREARRRRIELLARCETLTEKERLVLERMAAGQPSRQISVEIGVSIRTVELRRSKLMQKLSVGTVPQLERVAREILRVRPESTFGDGCG